MLRTGGQRLVQVQQKAAVRKIGEGIVVRKPRYFSFSRLALRHVGQGGDIVGQRVLFRPDRRDAQQFWKHITGFAPVPDFTLPSTVALQALVKGLIKTSTMASRSEQVGLAAHRVLRAVAGNRG
ncbi:MAG: hypothetical protein RLZZ573_414 [Pseudomonadota bacterium]|jgi:hypothetical protein